MVKAKKKIKKISKTRIEKAMEKKTDTSLKKLIMLLKKKKGDWLYLAYLLAKPKRKQAQVNLFKINKFSKANDVIIIPGKVLSQGTINHKIIIAALSFSENASQKLKNCEIKSIKELAGKDIKFKIII
jgi:large subunit ribosomal protein L18e